LGVMAGDGYPIIERDDGLWSILQARRLRERYGSGHDTARIIAALAYDGGARA
jgi:hypothetical protein